MPDRGDRELDEAALREFLEGLAGDFNGAEVGPEGFAGLVDPTGIDRELSRWPIIAATIPEPAPEADTQAAIEEVARSAMLQVTAAMADQTPDNVPLLDELSLKALVDIVFAHARTPEQVVRSLKGYLQTRVQLALKSQLHLVLHGSDGGMIDTNQIEEDIVRLNPARWQTLTQCARIPEWIVFRHALDTTEFERYALEPGHDGLFTLLADPSQVYMLGFDPEQEEMPIPKIERRTPESKRMTKAKLARFFSLPGLQRLIDEDGYNSRTAALGTNLTILAEYFCENDDVVNKNRVTPEDIQKWLEAKFAQHQPPVEVAWYIWARLQGTAFERISPFIEQYILDFYAVAHPWLFELGMKRRDQCKGTGALFELYRNALMACNYSLNPDDKARYPELLKILPSIYLFQTVLASQVYGGDQNIKELLAHYAEQSADFTPQFKCLKEIDLEKDSLEPLREAFDWEDEPPYEWKAIEGFELLDPVEIYKAGTINRLHAIGILMAGAIQKLTKTEDARVLKRFKKEVFDRLHPVKQKVVRQFIEEAAMPLAAKAIFEQASSDVVVAVARGEATADVPKRIILPGDVEWRELVGADFDVRRISTAAEQELLRRHLKGARGADEITQYLMSHVGTMRPSEVVRPDPEAPHDDVVREYGESPDLLALLDMTTLLTYLGYTPDQIRAEIGAQAELAHSAARPELAMIGVESELVGAVPEGPIIDPQRFAWLFNVLPRDPKDAIVNEIMTAPTASPVMQAALLSLMTDRRFGFVDADRLWEQTARADRGVSSLHLNISIPAGLPFTADLIHRYMFELQRIQWLAHGGDQKQNRIARGRVSHWRRNSLLDVMSSVDRTTKAEIRNLSLEADGSHIRRMRQLQMIASACIQYMREQAGLKLTSSGRVMAQIYERFQVESRGITGNEEGATVLAESLIERYSAEIEAELGVKPVAKTDGIIVIPA